MRIVAGRERAGRGLTSALDHRFHAPCGLHRHGQLFSAPMTEVRAVTDGSLDGIEHWVWDNRSNRVGRNGYPAMHSARTMSRPVRPQTGGRTSQVLPRRTSRSDIELFYSGDTGYTRRLEHARVSVDLEVVPGAPDDFESWASRNRTIPDAPGPSPHLTTHNPG